MYSKIHIIASLFCFILCKPVVLSWLSIVVFYFLNLAQQFSQEMKNSRPSSYYI